MDFCRCVSVGGHGPYPGGRSPCCRVAVISDQDFDAGFFLNPRGADGWSIRPLHPRSLATRRIDHHCFGSTADDGAGGRAANRKDPFGAFPKGTHTSLQPGLVIFTDKHYSRTTDTAAEPRPTTGYKTPGKPALEELQAQWVPLSPTLALMRCRVPS
jgi:hypothetical protein